MLTKKNKIKIGDTCLNIEFRLPLFLMQETWDRYGYTIEDIKNTLKVFPSKYLWQCALQFEILPSTSSLQATLSMSDYTTVGSKSIVIGKLISSLRTVHIGEKSVLKPDCKNVPKIPLVSCHFDQFSQVVKITKKLKLSIFHTTEVGGLFIFKDIKCVPLERENQHLKCARVEFKKEYLDSGRQIENKLCSYSPTISYNGEEYSVTEELFYLTNPLIDPDLNVAEIHLNQLHSLPLRPEGLVH